MSRLRKILIVLLLLATSALVVGFNLDKPRVLVLHSYDKDYAWSRDVNAGLRRVLDDKPHYAVRWFYMDAKRHPWPDYKENIGRSARRMVDDWKPDVVIAVDDDAQAYVMKHYAGRPDIRIVFAGVNGEPAAYGYEGAGNVTGILERKELAFVKDTLLTLAAGRPVRVVHIGDNSESVANDDRYMRSLDWRPVQMLDSRLVDSFEAWQAAVLATAGKADFIITTNYRKLPRSAGDKALVPAREVVRWTVEHSPVPVIGTNGFYVEDGGALAIGTSPYEQGEVAAGLAVELIEKGTPPASLPVRAGRQFVVYMRESGMRASGMALPRFYESFARATRNYFD
ncbi:MAG: ABC transporter substrate-binding protein [Actinomycetota bacterium]